MVKISMEYQKVKYHNFPTQNMFTLQWDLFPVDKHVEITSGMFHPMTSMELYLLYAKRVESWSIVCFKRMNFLKKSVISKYMRQKKKSLTVNDFTRFKNPIVQL